MVVPYLWGWQNMLRSPEFLGLSFSWFWIMPLELAYSKNHIMLSILPVNHMSKCHTVSPVKDASMHVPQMHACSEHWRITSCVVQLTSLKQASLNGHQKTPLFNLQCPAVSPIVEALSKAVMQFVPLEYIYIIVYSCKEGSAKVRVLELIKAHGWNQNQAIVSLSTLTSFETT